jgi:plastocyanin
VPALVLILVLILLVILAPAAASPPPAAAAVLTGRIELTGPEGAAARADAEPAVVYWRPASPAAGRPEPGRFQLITRGKQFEPRVLTVPRGSTVEFPNADPILHNVFSVSKGNAFDLGLVARGPGRPVVLDSAGVVRVFCNVHHSMVGYLVVLDTRFHTRTDASGRFRLSGLPDGDGTLHVWHEQAEPLELGLRLPAAAPLRLRLTVDKPRVPPHLNKLGRSYWRSKRDRYRN